MTVFNYEERMKDIESRIIELITAMEIDRLLSGIEVEVE